MVLRNPLKSPLEKNETAVFLALNGEIIYGFWFWIIDSSAICDRVYTYNRPTLHLKFGRSEKYRYGKDPRFNNNLKKDLNTKFNTH